MTDETNEATEDQPQAILAIWHDGKGMAADARALDGVENTHPASHFAEWLCKHAQALWLLSRDDYARHLEQHKAARKLLEASKPRLVAADGGRLN